ncbi:hypothetical protein V8017_03715 [Stenotrophomonas rhizophila]
MAVQLLDAARLQGGGERGRHVGRDRRIAPFAAGNGEAAGDAVGVALLQARGEQRAVARGQSVGGGQAALGIFGALGEFVGHGNNGLQRTPWNHSGVSMFETHRTRG